MTYSESNPDFDKVHGSVKYNGIEVITFHQKTAIYDPYVQFNLFEMNIEEALSKPVSAAEEKVDEDPAILDYRRRLTDRLFELEGIIFGDAARRGYGSWIGLQFPYLIALREENPAEHDAVIASNEHYTKLLEMFPNWSDPKGLQARYVAMDVGPFAALAMSASTSRTGEKPECTIC